jgi:RNA polymerase sigma factor (sigma-70 family)
LILKEKLDIVLQAIPTLKRKYRDLINARIDGLSYKEIANKLAMNELAVKGDLNKARQKLKQKTDY